MDFSYDMMAVGDLGGSPLPTGSDFSDVPYHLDVLPDGRESIVLGDVTQFADFNHWQGDNDLHFNEDCGLVSCQDVLNQFGMDVNENDIVNHAAEYGECDTSEKDPFYDGGTVPREQVAILADYGIPAHVDHAQSLEDLASDVEHGRSVIIAANAGYLWNDPRSISNPDQPNHAVSVTGVAIDPSTGQVQGFYINDSGTGKSAEFVSASTMEKAWVSVGGTAVVTDATHVEPASFAPGAGV